MRGEIRTGTDLDSQRHPVEGVIIIGHDVSFNDLPVKGVRFWGLRFGV